MNDDLNNKLEAMTKTILDGMDGLRNELKTEINELRVEIKGVRTDAARTKLELLDKLASKDTTDNHELRIQNLEKQAA